MIWNAQKAPYVGFFKTMLHKFKENFTENLTTRLELDMNKYNFADKNLHETLFQRL